MEECVKICNSPRLLFDGSTGQGTYHIPAIMGMFLFGSHNSSNVSHAFLKSDTKSIKITLNCLFNRLNIFSHLTPAAMQIVAVLFARVNKTEVNETGEDSTENMQLEKFDGVISFQKHDCQSYCG